MGLDMYLNKKMYIGANFEHNKISGNVTLLRDGKPIQIEVNTISEITMRFIYWRKENAIHRWFVENVQKNVDDCGTYEVSREQLTTLLTALNAAIENPTAAKEVLPTASGFFFGRTEYDEWYFKALQKTANTLTEELAKPEDYNISYEYHSSW